MQPNPRLGWDPYRNQFGGSHSQFARDAHQRALENSQKRRIAEAKALLPFDLTDQILRQVQKAESLRQTTGRTRQSTFGAATLLGG